MGAGAGLYIHIPFCVLKCKYCDFVSFPVSGCDTGAYLRALCAEMRARAGEFRDYTFDTVFFGGGTPSCLPERAISALMREIRGCLCVSGGAEITIEANPATFSRKKLDEYIDCGVNRISIGMQAAQDGLLRLLGRAHTAADFDAAVKMAKDAGFANISVDTMYGLPRQTLRDWEETLEAATSAGVTHISCYSLIFEDGTEFERLRREGKICPAGEDEEALMQDFAIRFLAQRGYIRYEISNYAKPGYECRHNLNYWRQGEYLGLGLAAHSCVRWEGRITRLKNTADLERYVGMGPGTEVVDRLDEAGEMFEYVMLAFRLVSGFGEDDFMKRFGVGFFEAYPEAERLERDGLIMRDGGRVFLSARGLDLQNMVMGELMG